MLEDPYYDLISTRTAPSINLLGKEKCLGCWRLDVRTVDGGQSD
jgi:hypothetical protein